MTIYDRTASETFETRDGHRWELDFFVDVTEQTNPAAIDLRSIVWADGLGLFVAVGQNDGVDSYIVTSPDGITWTERANPKDFPLYTITWANELGLLVAAGFPDGSDTYMVTSTDGITWTERSNPANNEIRTIAWSGTLFLAAGDDIVYRSYDGITWESASTPTVIANVYTHSMIYEDGLFYLVTETAGLEGYIYSTADGTSWTEEVDGTGNGLRSASIASDGNGTIVAFGARSSGDIKGYRRNPSTGAWENKTFFAAPGWDSDGVFWAAGLFFALGRTGEIYTSVDGLTWNEEVSTVTETMHSFATNVHKLVFVGADDGVDANILTAPAPTSVFYERPNDKNIGLVGITWNGGQFVAVGEADGTDAYLLTSSDGIVWAERPNPKNFTLNSVVWAGELTRYVAVGAVDGSDAYILTSPDGLTWTERSNPKNFGLNAVIWDGSQFVAVGDADGTDAYIVTSSDGFTWTERANPKNFALYGVDWDGSQFVAVGAADGTDAYILTSPDAITWTERANPKNVTLYKVTCSSSEFVAVGEADGADAYIVTSADGITWTERANPKNFILRSVAREGSKYIAVGFADGTDAYMIESTDGGVTWSERLNPKNISLRNITYGGGKFVAVGFADGSDAYILTSAYVSSGGVVYANTYDTGVGTDALTTNAIFSGILAETANISPSVAANMAVLLSEQISVTGTLSSLAILNRVLTETANVRALAIVGWAILLSETANISSPALNTFEIDQVITEALETEDGIATLGVFNHLLSETADIAEQIIFAWGQVLTETVNVTSPASGKFELLIELLDELEADDTVGSTELAYVVAAVTAAFTDVVAGGKGGFLTDGVNIAAALAEALYASAAAVEALTITPAVNGSLLLSIPLEEEASITGALSSAAVLQNLISDGVSFALSFGDGDYTFTGWVLNTENFALTEYSNYPFNSFAKIGNNYYGANSNGIYLLDGEDDAGTLIDAHFITGKMPFGNAKSRINSAYLAIRTDGRMYVKTITDDDAERWYELHDEDWTLQQKRVKMSRGVKSFYWQFEISNADGSDFEIDSLTLTPIVLQRRST